MLPGKPSLPLEAELAEQLTAFCRMFSYFGWWKAHELMVMARAEALKMARLSELKRPPYAKEAPHE